ncbi:MAG: hypothetical protein Q7S66_05990 [bacterium]|nr:hypothetical protein [bacterium]
MKHKTCSIKYKTRRLKQASCFRFYALGSRGFTMVEIVVMLAIIIIVSAIVLVNFPSVSASIALQRTVQQFSLKFRQAQNQALAVRLVLVQGGSIVPPAVGIYISIADPTHYIFFADICPAAPDNNKIYDSGCDIVIETVNVEKGITIAAMVDEMDSNQSAVSVVYTAPEARTFISNAFGTIGESVLVKFNTEAGNLTRSVRVRTSGQIGTE